MLGQGAGSVGLCSLSPLPCISRQYSGQAARPVSIRKAAPVLPVLPTKGPLVSTGFSRETCIVRDIKVQSAGDGGSLIEDNKDTLVNGYLLVSVLYAAIGIIRLAVPQKMASVMASTSLTAMNEYLVRANGLFALLLAVLVYSMKEGAENRALQGDTYKRIGLWVTVHAILAFVITMNSEVKIAAKVIMGAIPAVLLALYWKAYKNIPVAEVVPNMLSSVKDALTPSNWKAGAFSFLAAAAVVEVAAFLIAPDKMWTKIVGAAPTGVGSGLAKSCLIGVATMAVAAYTLKDGAEKGLMGQAPFKNINLATGLLVAANCVLFGAVYPEVFKPLFEKKALFYATALINGFYAIFCGYLYVQE